MSKVTYHEGPQLVVDGHFAGTLVEPIDGWYMQMPVIVEPTTADIFSGDPDLVRGYTRVASYAAKLFAVPAGEGVSRVFKFWVTDPRRISEAELVAAIIELAGK